MLETLYKNVRTNSDFLQEMTVFSFDKIKLSNQIKSNQIKSNQYYVYFCFATYDHKYTNHFLQNSV